MKKNILVLMLILFCNILNAQTIYPIGSKYSTVITGLQQKFTGEENVKFVDNTPTFIQIHRIYYGEEDFFFYYFDNEQALKEYNITRYVYWTPEYTRDYTTTVNMFKSYYEGTYADLINMYGNPSIEGSSVNIWNHGNETTSLITRIDQENNTYRWGMACITKLSPKKTISVSKEINEYQTSGSGIIITTNGIIVTNHHVIEGASVIDIQLTRNGEVKTYRSKVLVDDKTNDLALLKIEDVSFQNFLSIPYALKTSICDVGTSVFAMGYPMSNYLGEEVKITDGLISSKTGYQGDIVTYQISVPIQHGNSGGPLFDKQGNLVGITNAGIPEADNVGYAIKTSYLKNLIDVSPIPINIPSNNKILNLSFTEKIKVLSDYIVHIKIK